VSIERELLRRAKCLLECSNMEPLQRQSDIIIGEIKELLEQPEQEDIKELLAQPEQTEQEDIRDVWQDGYEVGLRLAKREPLSDLDVFTLYEEAEYIGFLAYRKGIKDAEKAHGIGGR
jgi:hypothetical protein